MAYPSRVYFRERLKIATAELSMLARAFRHPRTPWYAKVWLLLLVAYAVSPIDLIPDPIPLLGYLDDALLLPLGVAVALQLIPTDVKDECRGSTHEPASTYLKIVGFGLVFTAWLMSLVLGYLGVRYLVR